MRENLYKLLRKRISYALALIHTRTNLSSGFDQVEIFQIFSYCSLSNYHIIAI